MIASRDKMICLLSLFRVVRVVSGQNSAAAFRSGFLSARHPVVRGEVCPLNTLNDAKGERKIVTCTGTGQIHSFSAFRVVRVVTASADAPRGQTSALASRYALLSTRYPAVRRDFCPLNTPNDAKGEQRP